jgi:hypothetical protein
MVNMSRIVSTIPFYPVTPDPLLQHRIRYPQALPRPAAQRQNASDGAKLNANGLLADPEHLRHL